MTGILISTQIIEMLYFLNQENLFSMNLQLSTAVAEYYSVVASCFSKLWMELI